MYKWRCGPFLRWLGNEVEIITTKAKFPVSGSIWSSNISTNHVHKCKCRSMNPQGAGCVNTGVAYQKQKIYFVWPEFNVYPSIIHDLDISFFVNKMFHYVLVTTFGRHVYGSTLIEGEWTCSVTDRITNETTSLLISI